MGYLKLSEVSEDQFVGTPLRVLAIDEDDNSVHALFQSGQIKYFTVPGGNLPDVGQVILLNDSSYRLAPNDLFRVSNSIAVVRRLQEDGSLLVEAMLGLKRIENPFQLQVGIGNTIEFNDYEGLVGVISDAPINLRETEVSEDEIRRDYLVSQDIGGPTFADFGGYPNVIARARELIATQFQSRDRLSAIGANPVKGILFTGLPGTGKTFLARIIANETDADFYLISGPSIVSKWVGDTEARVRSLFQAASKSRTGKAIIFFDEIDSIAERRTEASHEASKRLVAQMLTLMDGFRREQNIVVIAATNRVEALDPALTRPGRFDWEIEFGLPTLPDRLAILSAGARHLKTDGELPLEDIAALSDGWSAARLTALWSEAALLSASDGRAQINAEDMAMAFERVDSRPNREQIIVEIDGR